MCSCTLTQGSKYTQHADSQCLYNYALMVYTVHMPLINPPLTVTEASQKTGIKVRTLQAAIARGDLAAHKTGGQTAAYLIDPDDLAAWVATRATSRVM